MGKKVAQLEEMLSRRQTVDQIKDSALRQASGAETSARRTRRAPAVPGWVARQQMQLRKQNAAEGARQAESDDVQRQKHLQRAKQRADAEKRRKAAAAQALKLQVRKTPIWPRSWANFSLL